MDRAVTLGLAGLREHAGDVLLQDTDEHALSIARACISDAVEMARWFLGTRGPAEATITLSSSAGAWSCTPPPPAAGLADILRAKPVTATWPRNGPAPAPAARPPDTEPGGDLRYRVMTGHRQSHRRGPAAGTAPAGDITASLQRRETDALVYLLPGIRPARVGLAVIVDPAVRSSDAAAGPAHRRRSPVSAFLRTRRTVSQPTAAAGRRPGAWLPALDTSAMGLADGDRPAAGRGTQPGRRDAGADRPRANGRTGAVPWHAAREQPAADTGMPVRRVFSYAASARQFVDTARLRPRPWAQAPVLISDAAASAYFTELASVPAVRSLPSGRRFRPGLRSGS